MINFQKASKKTPFDAADAAVLIVAMDKVRETFDLSLAPAKVFAVAVEAATLLPSLVADEGDDWDGVVWFEILEDATDRSLAHTLYIGCIEGNSTVLAIVDSWSRANGFN